VTPAARDSRTGLQRRHRFFRSLLAANNLILEELTGLERLIHEGRSFTLDEASGRVRGLVTRCCSLVEDLNAICGAAFPELFDRVETVGRDAMAVLTRERTFDSPILIRPLEEITLDNLDEVGGKAANLGEVRNRVGLPTPDGFAITASAAALFLRHSGLQDAFLERLAGMDIKDIGALELACAKMSEQVMVAPLPDALENALMEKIREAVARFGSGVRLAVRSSAVCEDSAASFAGQHASVLGAAPTTLPRAWSAVVASAFTARAVFYRRSKGYSEQDVMMSVLVLAMIRSRAGGVLYTVDPNSARGDDVLIAGAWGLGVSVVDGSMDVDFWRVRRNDRSVLEKRIADKATEYVELPQGGIVARPVPEHLRDAPCLTPDQITTLTDYGIRLEEHYGMPQDVEWALDGEGRLFIIQARPLARAEGVERGDSCHYVPGRVPLLAGGQSAALGVACGPAFVVDSDRPLTDMPAGAILVARQTSPAYVAAMGTAAGIVTNVGSATGHMASVAREFGIPTLVGAEGATRLISHGREITVDATNRVVYAGRVNELLTERKPVNLMKGSPVFKSLQEALQHLTPLILVDPLEPDFTAANCRTLHDIIRFCHEEAMQAMFRLTDGLSPDEPLAGELNAPLPFRVLVLDLGGGVLPTAGPRIEMRDLNCAPLKALLDGMMLSGAPSRKAHPEAASYAVVSAEYMNFSGRLGNHFATVDTWSGPVINDNYITFSFKGGAAEYAQRVRRASLLAGVLRRLGFRVVQGGDSLKAEIRKYDETRFLDRLVTVGRLLASVRALDRRLDDDAEVTRLINAFFEGGHSLPGV
jgi:pyruvate,water dikinase